MLDVGGGQSQGLDLAQLPVQGLSGYEVPQAGEGRVDALSSVSLPHVGDDPRLLWKMWGLAEVSEERWLSLPGVLASLSASTQSAVLKVRCLFRDFPILTAPTPPGSDCLRSAQTRPRSHWSRDHARLDDKKLSITMRCSSPGSDSQSFPSIYLRCLRQNCQEENCWKQSGQQTAWLQLTSEKQIVVLVSFIALVYNGLFLLDTCWLPRFKNVFSTGISSLGEINESVMSNVVPSNKLILIL